MNPHDSLFLSFLSASTSADQSHVLVFFSSHLHWTKFGGERLQQHHKNRVKTSRKGRSECLFNPENKYDFCVTFKISLNF